jgi:glycosyltransferase involved in cell wall biosynthesis
MIEPALVSIGLPVHNEASHVDAALTALRAQDYPRLEIIVCDNASTDATLAICQRHADADPRIRIESAPENIGATANFRRSFDLAQGEFFMWASGHDLWSPGLLTECVALLQDHHDACLAYASCDWIGPDGEPFARESGWYDTRGMVAAARFFTVLWGNMHPVLGVMRSSTLRDCGSVPALIGGDLVLLADLSLRGSFLHAVQSRWSRLAKVFPLVKLPLELFKRVWRARIGALDKAVMLAALVPALALRYRVGRRGQSH